jgi:hypothetical protein
VLGTVPGGPAVTGGRAVEVGAGPAVERAQLDGMGAAPPAGGDLGVVVEAATTLADGFGT